VNAHPDIASRAALGAYHDRIEQARKARLIDHAARLGVHTSGVRRNPLGRFGSLLLRGSVLRWTSAHQLTLPKADPNRTLRSS
jgi:hypothetical protein